MNFTEMNIAVSDIVQDQSFKTSWIDAGLEAALVFISSIFPLPLLVTTDVVTFAADEDSHAMPLNYHWNAVYAHNTTDNLKVTLWPSVKNMLDEYGYTTDKYVNLQDVAIEERLMYAPFQVDSEQIIKVWYSKKADLLTTDENCLAIPAHLHEELLVNRVAEKAFNLIEDGIDGDKVNWKFMRSEFKGGLAMLREFYPQTGEHITHIKRNSFRF